MELKIFRLLLVVNDVFNASQELNINMQVENSIRTSCVLKIHCLLYKHVYQKSIGSLQVLQGHL